MIILRFSIPGIGKLDDLLQPLLPLLFSTTCQSSGNSRSSFDNCFDFDLTPTISSRSTFNLQAQVLI